jgi:hypothetical protein
MSLRGHSKKAVAISTSPPTTEILRCAQNDREFPSLGKALFFLPLEKRGIKGDLIFKISLNLSLPKGDLMMFKKKWMVAGEG